MTLCRCDAARSFEPQSQVLGLAWGFGFLQLDMRPEAEQCCSEYMATYCREMALIISTPA